MTQAQLYRQKTGGFTLIELLVVIAIISTLMGLLLPIVSLAKNSSKATKTRSLLAKIDVGCRLFRNDIGLPPWNDCSKDTLSDPLPRNLAWFDPAMSAGAPSLDAASSLALNRLGWNLGHVMSTTERANFNLNLAKVDADTAFQPYSTYISASNRPWLYVSYKPNSWSPSVGSALSSSDFQPLRLNGIITKIWRERARVSLMAGNYTYRPQRANVTVSTKCGNWGTDSIPLVTTNPAGAPAQLYGWTDDYIGTELQRADRSRLDQRCLVDAWGSPIVYIAPLYPGADPSATGGASPMAFVPVPGEKDTAQFSGQPASAGTGVTDVVEGVTVLRDPFLVGKYGRKETVLLTDPALTTASFDYCFDAEVWSMGQDLKCQNARSDKLNKDNVSYINYKRGLK
jgi:prepilin-type N-terminal cleavage/methylation domain-containing protein